MSLPSLILSFLSLLQLATGFVTKIFRSNYALLCHVIRNYKMLPLVHIAFDKKDNHHRGPLFFLPLTLWFCYENLFIKCSLIWQAKHDKSGSSWKSPIEFQWSICEIEKSLCEIGKSLREIRKTQYEKLKLLYENEKLSCEIIITNREWKTAMWDLY